MAWRASRAACRSPRGRFWSWATTRSPPAGFRAPFMEFPPGIVTHDGDLVEIVHSRPTEMAIGDRKSGGLDDVGFEIETGAQTQNGPGVLRDIRLKKRDPHQLGALMT